MEKAFIEEEDIPAIAKMFSKIQLYSVEDVASGVGFIDAVVLRRWVTIEDEGRIREAFVNESFDAVEECSRGPIMQSNAEIQDDSCSINTPSGGGCMHSSRRRPCGREKRKGTRSNALGRTRTGSSGRAGRVTIALVYAIQRIDASTPLRGTGGRSNADGRRRIPAPTRTYAIATRVLLL